MSVDIRIEGIEKLMLKLDEIEGLDGVKQAMQQSCAMVEKTAKKTAPKKTGNLRRSIGYEVESGGNTVVGTVTATAPYSAFVEFGTGERAEKGNGRKDVPWGYEDEQTGEVIWTKGSEPKPFMRPALKENKAKIIKRLKRSFNFD